MEILHRFLRSTAVPLFHPFAPTERIFLLYLAGALVLAVFVFWADPAVSKQRPVPGFFRYCFPKAIYFHRSAVMDYMYFVFYKMFFFFLVIPFLITQQAVAGRVLEVFSKIHPPLGIQPSLPVLFTFVFTLSAFVIADFGIFLAHYLQHKVPVLWEFHKVHHSAEVLTPMTVYRMHPVDDILSATLVSLFAGFFSGFWLYFFDQPGRMITLMGVNMFVFAYYLFGYNLRHSHIWLSYGPFWSRILISPAQHQIHHSVAREHVDKNIGFVFSFWDELFGTLVVPDRKLDIEYGLRHGEDKEFQFVGRLFLLPFKKCLQKWGPFRKPSS